MLHVTMPAMENRTLYHGDNLPFLRALPTDSIDLIATDPPFNKGKDFHAAPGSLADGASFQDRWSWTGDVQPGWVTSLSARWPAAWMVIQAACGRDGEHDALGAYLCFLAVRLAEMHRILKPTGSIYLHCDPTASHYIKAIMDRDLRTRQLPQRDRVVLCPAGRAPKYGFHRKHDTILYYSKGTPVFHHQFTEMSPATRAAFNKADDAGRSYRVLHGRIAYLDDYKGRPVPSWWTDIPSFGSASNSAERTGYPTQKPLALYERIISASSNPGDMVLDPFCGCATTLAAAERLGRQWLGMDVWDGAYDLAAARTGHRCGWCRVCGSIGTCR